LSILGWRPSGLHDLFTSRFCNNFNISLSKKYQEYAKTRNQVKSAIKKAKANMEKKIAKHVKSNPKIFWKYANFKRKTNTD
jgi:hypothetical protein